MEKNLEIKIRITDDNLPVVEIYEPESGDFRRLECKHEPIAKYDDPADKAELFQTQVAEAVAQVADELYSWYQDLMEEKDFMENRNGHDDPEVDR